ncbi:MAG TPA: hypothetical protein VKV28_15080 [Candidatus Binataceae bacterium]|nr:hypothetical protein [Candidatus Binataceae bacterium]
MYAKEGPPSIAPEELLRGLLLQLLLARQARAQGLISAEHFTVDGTLIEAWAGHQSFQRKHGGPTPPPDIPGSPGIDFCGETAFQCDPSIDRDPQARLYKKFAGQEARLCYLGHLLMENRNGPVVNARLTEADGHAERRSTLAIVEEIPGFRCVALGADKGYDAKEFCARTARSSDHTAPQFDLTTFASDEIRRRRVRTQARPHAGCSIEIGGPSDVI